MTNVVRRKLSPLKKTRIIEMYTLGHTAKEIAREYDISESRVRQILAKAKADGLLDRGVDRKMQTALKEAFQEQYAAQGENLAKVAIRAKEMHLKALEYSTKITVMEIKNAMENKVPFEAIDGNLKALDKFSAIVNRNYLGISKLLHLDREDDSAEKLTKFEIIPMDSRMVDQMRDQQAIEEMAVYGGLDESDEDEEDDDITETS